ncbi:hypothetical protein [Nocardia sp. NPDC057440]|uniref:hypothetical protein n=1 Tax=Nocardia sp. NPDC057440 TaxID=3346134 RepID=UPI00366E2675
MPNNELPQRDPFTGPPTAYTGPTIYADNEVAMDEVVCTGEAATNLCESFGVALREWAGPPPASAESSRWRGDEPPAIGRTTPPPTQAEV